MKIDWKVLYWPAIILIAVLLVVDWLISGEFNLLLGGLGIVAAVAGYIVRSFAFKAQEERKAVKKARRK